MDQQQQAGIIEVGRQADHLPAASMNDQDLPERPTVAEVARWLRKCTATVYIWAKAGEIPCTRAGRSYIFDKEALLRWAKSEEVV